MKNKALKQRAGKGKTSTEAQSINPKIHPDAAGIDIGSEELVAAIPAGRDPSGSVKTFRTFTSGVEALRDWLLKYGVNTVALESTGNYWITTYDVLEAAGIEVYLVNARHVKGVPGKKTDVCDAQWLQQLHAAGLLRKSHRPAQAVLPLRYLMRHRSSLVEESSRSVQRMQKVLTELNLKIQHVFSDIDGQSAQAIISAILAGERDPAVLAGLRDRRCRSSEADIIEALKGTYRSEYLSVLGQLQKQWQFLQTQIAENDRAIETAARAVTSSIEPEPSAKTQEQNGAEKPAEKKAVRKKSNKNSIGLVMRELGKSYYGVDLCEIPGVGDHVIATLMSELGPSKEVLRNFRSSGAFCSWLALCPDNRISGGRVLKAKTRRVSNRVAAALRLGVWTLERSDHAMGHYTRRMKGRLGKAEGITASAHKLGRIIYGMLESQAPYDEKTAFQTTAGSAARRIKSLQKQAQSLGFQLIANQ